MSDHEHYEALLMKAVDGVMDDAERRELDDHMSDCPDCRRELDDFRAIKETTDAMTQRILQDAVIEPPPEGVVRLGIALSMLFILAGALLLVGFGGYLLAMDPQVPRFVKLGAGLCGLGGLGLLAYTLSLRWRARGGRDPYQEIDR